MSTDVLRPALLPLAIAAGVALLGEQDGGYFPTSWGWAGLVALFAVVAIVLTRPLRLSRLEALYLGGLAAVTAWTAVSALWSLSLPSTVDEVERSLVYPAAVLAVLLAARRAEDAAPVLAGTLLGATALGVHGLVNRLLPDVDAGLVGGDGRLGGPITYSNGFGLVCVLGIVLALGVAATAARPAWTMLAAAAVVPLVLALYFTFSRGGWAALLVGVAVTLALTRERAATAAAALSFVPLSALAVWLASRSVPLSLGFPTTADVRDGHRLAVAVLVLAAAQAVLTPVARRAAGRLVPSPALRRRAALALALAAVAALAGGLAWAGGPVAAARGFYRDFSTGSRGPTATSGGVTTYDPRARLFSLQGSERSRFWAAALHDFAAHPLAGSGAGTYDIWWLRHRRTVASVQDAHSLYLETLAELGVVGLVLLLAALAVPLAAAVRARGTALVPAAAGAYAAYLAEAGADWDWELTGVTLIGLLCGAALVLARRPAGEAAEPRPVVRLALAAPTLALLGFVLVTLVGSSAVVRAQRAAAAGRWPVVESAARRATAWTPWNPEGWRLRAEVELSRGRAAAAAADLRTALAHDPNDWRLWLRLAQVEPPGARAAALARAHELDPIDAPGGASGSP